MSFKVRPESAAILTAEDHSVLHAIYQHRCLNEEQLSRFFYSGLDDGKNGYTLDRINALIEAGFIESHEYKPDRWVYFLTYTGVQYVRDTADRSMYRILDRSGRKKYEATAGELLLPNSMLDHQCRLNDLALNIISACKLDPSCYKDNLFASNFTYAQPDGVIELPEFDLFLEMDMGHERSRALREKWEHYRAYFRSRDYQLHRNKKVIVLFATENVKNIVIRRRTVVRSLAQYSMDLIGPMFDCYIGPNKQVLTAAKNLIVGGSPEFEQAKALLKKVHGCRPGWSKIINASDWGDGHFWKIPGGGTLVLVDGYSRPMSELKRIAYFGQTLASLRNTPYQNLRLLVLVPGEIDIFRDLLGAELQPEAVVHYVTLERLQKDTFHEALFVFDQLGNRYHFAQPDLKELCYEKQQFRFRQKYK